VKVAVTGGTYKVFGYKGKQVRDNIHSYDVIQAFEAFRRNPRPGAVYNLGGGRENSISILEAFDLVEEISGKTINWVYVDKNRIGDHICYISDLTKLKADFPEWKITRSLTTIVQEIIATAESRNTVSV
jgi:CDP-paratose 2-epimerase